MQVDWRGHSIGVREAGEGPALILLHGYPLDGGMWSGAARRLSESFRVLKPDFPGRPDNPAELTGRIDDYADFVEAILGELPRPIGVAGFSMGGYVTFALVKRRPKGIGALALIDTRAGADDEAGRARREEAIE